MNYIAGNNKGAMAILMALTGAIIVSTLLLILPQKTTEIAELNARNRKMEHMRNIAQNAAKELDLAKGRALASGADAVPVGTECSDLYGPRAIEVNSDNTAAPGIAEGAFCMYHDDPGADGGLGSNPGGNWDKTTEQSFRCFPHEAKQNVDADNNDLCIRADVSTFAAPRILVQNEKNGTVLKVMMPRPPLLERIYQKALDKTYQFAMHLRREWVLVPAAIASRKFRPPPAATQADFDAEVVDFEQCNDIPIGINATPANTEQNLLCQICTRDYTGGDANFANNDNATCVKIEFCSVDETLGHCVIDGETTENDDGDAEGIADYAQRVLIFGQAFDTAP